VGADERHELPERLPELITALQRAAQGAMVGSSVGGLFEKPGRQPGQMVGKSDHLDGGHVAAPQAQIGQLAQVKIVAAGPTSLTGEWQGRS